MEISLEIFHKKVQNFISEVEAVDLTTRYNQLRILDPYPSVPPSLLNAGQIASYALATGMIHPFEIQDLAKPATYLIPLSGPVRFLDEYNIQQRFYLSSVPVEGEPDVRKEFVLRPNSLCYVTLKPKFQMPAYIVGRFNLLIRDVYRGLLVGTGPLVDPGFVGYLSVPVHNFTSNEYIVKADEGFVYFEFTKLSWSQNFLEATRPAWVPTVINDQPPFPKSKNKRRVLDDYIESATGGGPAQNALGAEIRKVTQTSELARSRIQKITAGAVISAVLFLLTAIAGTYGTFQTIIGALQFVQSSQNDTSSSIDKLKDRINALETAEAARSRSLKNPSR